MTNSNLSNIDPQVKDDETFRITFECSLFGPSEIVKVNESLYIIDAFIEQFPSFAEAIRTKLGQYNSPPLNIKTN